MGLITLIGGGATYFNVRGEEKKTYFNLRGEVKKKLQPVSSPQFFFWGGGGIALIQEPNI